MKNVPSILVTGAAAGIGKSTALLFASRGWHVGCYDIDAEGARAVAEQAKTATHGHLDVADEASWSAAVADFERATGGRMNVLCNNAGICKMDRFESIPNDFYRRTLDVNVMGVILGIRACLPLLERTEGAAIVNMSSASAIYGAPELAVYSASKFAVRALTEALDVELRGRVRVCDVMPSFVDTALVRDQTHRPRSMRRLGVKLTAEDVAEVVWKAAHGKGLHYVPQVEMNVLGRLQGLLPELGRVVMRRMG